MKNFKDIREEPLSESLYEKNYTLGPDTVKVTCKGVLGLKNYI